MWIKTIDGMYNSDYLTAIWLEDADGECRTCAQNHVGDRIVLSWHNDVRGIIKQGLINEDDYVEVIRYGR